MSERGRFPRRLIDDRRGFPDARVVDIRGAYPDIHMVDDRRVHRDIGVVARSAVRVVPDRGGYADTREGLLMRGAPHPHPHPHPRPHPAALQEEFALQEVELQRMLADNRALVEERDILHRQVLAGKDEVDHLNGTIAGITAEKEAYISKLVDKRRKLEADVRATEPLRDEVMHLRGGIDKLVAVREELSAEATSLMKELAREKSKNQQLPMLKAEIDGLRQELVNMRTACALEQKGNFELVAQRNAMEQNINSIAQEISQLQTELAKFEVRHLGTGGDYGIQMGSPEATFAAPYGDSYNIHVGVSEKAPLLPPESSSWGKYDKSYLQYR